MDILFRRSGFMACKPRHSFGPMVHDCFLFHIILSGSGVFEQEGKKYTLHTGQGFLIWLGKMAYYEADAHDPWKYAWLGFRGADALRLVGAMGLNEKPACLGAEQRRAAAALLSAHSARYTQVHGPCLGPPDYCGRYAEFPLLGGRSVRQNVDRIACKAEGGNANRIKERLPF